MAGKSFTSDITLGSVQTSDTSQKIVKNTINPMDYYMIVKTLSILVLSVGILVIMGGFLILSTHNRFQPDNIMK